MHDSTSFKICHTYWEGMYILVGLKVLNDVPTIFPIHYDNKYITLRMSASGNLMHMAYRVFPALLVNNHEALAMINYLRHCEKIHGTSTCIFCHSKALRNAEEWAH